ncbi:luciferase family oxidoreductase group 1 [Kitasatospora sp. MAA4]|uniref:MsnO8 family LLM class oxidoreductase n=1 Tax=Kitasatospora sp. MAA4 TaxID=3035093 RepID=UPI002474115F|nr:MsnO8 family LLM class oxidoreductase [Kitasatospora sp. MAA4]MDH6133718.1 luciferase family oxidoreductase group 1 [Kitasatospora sp. MAA4]
MKITVLDLCPVFTDHSPADALRATLDLAVAAQALGAARYWVAEHHGSPASAATSPDVLISAIAARTTTLPVGAGGVMLPNHSPLRVAESFATLARLHGPRIELGVGRALAGRAPLNLALNGTAPSSAPQEFRAKIGELLDHQQDLLAHGEPPVPLRVLGSSLPVALIAAELGLPYGFAGHLGLRGARESITAYRANYRPTPHHPEPDVVLSLGVYLADTPAQAQDLAQVHAVALLRHRQSRPGPLPTVEQARQANLTGPELHLVRRRLDDWIIGDRQSARQRLQHLAGTLGVTEIAAVTSTADSAARLRSYELLLAASGD